MLDKTLIPFFQENLTFWPHLTEDEKNLLLDHSMLKNYDQGENIHSGDNDCVGVLLILSGELRTYILSEDGRDITLYRLTEGEVCILSASCILSNITFDVHIDAEKASQVILINASIFQKICAQNIYAENFSYKSAIDRFSDVMWAMQQILFMSFDKRLTIFLLDEVSKTGSNIIQMTHEQIAKYVGSAREVVSRMLKYFEKEGYVKLSRGKIEVIDKVNLREMI
ncbi:MAG: family transcriptional regulator, anaerobic regulatory protein [Eubacteriaceae bacterium]|jgi:CRP/FNR family transcriptional regulator|nr:family transcriptional regulator, anaerobic regulatory protein [Eubacteriaceae bacterium]MDK2905960.1 family transcriptional regulator, anaerobic regulatory protein [Eubacteriaceae bacterium]MDN5308578.1 family transcriptional regulator, anaerobic regulatory protein [Eubacteriaceae bacterium]